MFLEWRVLVKLRWSWMVLGLFLEVFEVGFGEVFDLDEVICVLSVDFFVFNVEM